MRTLLVLVASVVLAASTASAQTCTSNANCADGNVCNGPERCVGGVCQPGTPPPDGQGCSIGNPCTNSDVCRGGVCVAGVIRPDGSGCTDGNDCNGRETCQQGVCTPGTPRPNGTECGDGNLCNGADTCQAGVCVVGAVPPEGALCSDGFACNGLEVCRSHVCTAGPRPPDGTSCADDNPCDGEETCVAGICRGGTPLGCDDGNECTNDSCDKTTGGCRHVPRSDNTACGDRDPCNGRETCQSGTCTPGEPPDEFSLCEDTNTCNGVEFCQNQRCTAGTPLPDGTSCADSNACNGLERCQGGLCLGGAGLQCADTNPCTADSCDPVSGCRYTIVPNGTSCDDRNVCNGIESCQSGSCTAGAPPACGALTCDPFAGCVVDTLITGRKLLLRAGGRAGTGVKVKVQTREQIPTSASQGTPADPVLHGGGRRLRSVGGGFDQRFELPRQHWEYLREADPDRGFRYRDRSKSAPIRSVTVKGGRLTKVLGGGPDVVASLASDPNPVEVTLIIGNQRYCMGFGGDTQFDAGTRYAAENAPAPAACPP